MWITADVDLPQAVIDAQNTGELVLFVGAGASLEAPSGLPLFSDLARELADLAQVSFDDSAAIDLFLGSMPKNFDVHARARDIIGREDSRPNATHEAIVRVASAAGNLRIVTTNFDTHLSTAATMNDVEIEETWVGPALPLGDEFEGIVHLHGSVEGKPANLVLTDSDFGKAYLTRAWATHFLLPMFQNSTVLFIGYSHDDPIMRYLALGLPSRTPRYAFASIDRMADPKWGRLGVEAIGYPVRDRSHHALVSALEAWAHRVRMGRSDHRARMDDIVSAGPSLSPVDRDYIVERINIEEGAIQFVSAVSDVEEKIQIEWLLWAESLPAFRVLFSDQDLSNSSKVLSRWFSNSFIASPSLSSIALQTVQRLGQKFSPSLFENACWDLQRLAEADWRSYCRWTTLLATSIHGHSAPVLGDALLPYEAGEHPVPLALMRAAVRPFMSLKRSWALEGPGNPEALPMMDVSWNVEESVLTNHLTTSAVTEDAIGVVLEESLNEAYDLVQSYQGEDGWDGFSFGRSAIEPHEQDSFRDPIDAIIDGLRDYGESRAPRRLELIESWWKNGRGLFRRLAVHLLGIDDFWSDDEKIAWLLNRRLLYCTDEKHEVYRVLRFAVPGATSTVRRDLLAATMAGPSLDSDSLDYDRHREYAIYNMLTWFQSVVPDWIEAKVALEGAQLENPSFSARDHPDFDHWMSSGAWGGKMPMDPEAFTGLLRADAPEAMEDLLSRKYPEHGFGEPGWDDAMVMVRTVCQKSPELGSAIWVFLGAEDRFEVLAADIRRAIVEGWAAADLSSDEVDYFKYVSTLVADERSARSVSRFLLEQMKRRVESEESPHLAEMRGTAIALWGSQKANFEHAEDSDPVSFAPLYMNSWPGDIAQFWAVEIDRRWRQNRDDWTGFTEQEKGVLKAFLESGPPTIYATLPSLASQLYFFFSADPAFIKENLLPWFKDAGFSRLAWAPYLFHARVDDNLLAAGLLDALLSQWGRVSELDGDSFRGRFIELTASIVAFSGIDSEQRRSLLGRSVIVDDGLHAAEMAVSFAKVLRETGIDRDEVWGSWLGEHITSRLNGIPRIAGAEELARLADVVPLLSSSMSDAIALFRGRGVGLGAGFKVPEGLRDAFSVAGEAIVDFYVDLISNSTPGNFILGRQVRKLIEIFEELDGEAGAALSVAAAERGLIGSSG